uniref:BHLH domain-containing protein n=1 Tax=Aegilops tauschii subsp. strangulata TaxID=200361 RepID=A0A453E4W1_AEGTS
MLGLMAAPCQSPQGENELYDDCDPTVYGARALLPRQTTSAPPAGPPEASTGSGRTATEARALKVHSEAERRRRVRINAHLAALRKMIPDTKQGQGRLAGQGGGPSEAPQEESKRGRTANAGRPAGSRRGLCGILLHRGHRRRR